MGRADDAATREGRQENPHAGLQLGKELPPVAASLIDGHLREDPERCTVIYRVPKQLAEGTEPGFELRGSNWSNDDRHGHACA